MINETLSGSATIRAFGKQQSFVNKNYLLLNNNILANQMWVGCWCWFGVRVDYISILIMGASTIVCMVYRFEEDPVLVAMTLSYILQLQDYLVSLLYSIGDLERSMVSV